VQEQTLGSEHHEREGHSGVGAARPCVRASNHDYLPSIRLEEELGRLDPREILTSTR
jgi:hypothetical protein